MKGEHPGLVRFAELLRADYGLTFTASRTDVLSRAVAEAMTERRLQSVAAYLEVVTSERAALDQLASVATTGETYFLRYPEQFAVLREFVLPSIIGTRVGDEDRVVRAWSAGCATGEEAYSLAMVLDAVISAAGWQPAVVGTDLNADAITRAASGRYGRWSFRDGDAMLKPGLTMNADGGATVDARIRSLVHFSVQNLAAADVRPPPGLRGAPDIVMCRNVLMYLENEAAQRVIDLIYRALRPGGWLLTGPSDVSSHAFRRFERRVVDGVTQYRRPTGPARRSTRPSREARGLASGGTDDERIISPAPARGPVRAAVARARRGDDPGRTDRDIAQARSLANSGRHQEARRICTAILLRDSRNVGARRLMVDIAEAEADLPAARDAIRALLRHVPDDTLLRFRLALVERLLGQHAASTRALVRAIAGIAHLSDDEQLGEGGEMSVLRLRSIGAAMSAGQLDA